MVSSGDCGQREKQDKNCYAHENIRKIDRKTWIEYLRKIKTNGVKRAVNIVQGRRKGQSN